MKKRMLITTIAMVLVVAVALTTSSLAWFTMSSEVTTSKVLFSAASAQGADLVFGKLNVYNTDNYSAKIGFAQPTGLFQPMQGKVTLNQFIKDTDGVKGWNVTNVGEENYQYLTLANNSIYQASDVKNADGSQGRAISQQLATLVGNTSAAGYWASGFNVRNTFGTAVSNISLKATLSITPADFTTATTNTTETTYTVNNGYVVIKKAASAPYICYNYGDEGFTVAETSTVVAYEAQDLALLGSLRVAMYHSNATAITAEDNALDDIALGAAAANAIYGYSGIKVENNTSNNTYKVTVAESTNNMAYQATVEADTYYATSELVAGETEATVISGTYTDSIIDMAFDPNTGKATFTFSVGSAEAKALVANGTSSFVFLMWMDGWDNECLPAASDGNMNLVFSVSGTADAA